MKIVSASDPIDFAKEIALDFELRGDYREEMIHGALNVMNSSLIAADMNIRSIIKALEAYELPTDDIDVEFMSEELIPKLRTSDVAVSGKIDSITWFGAVSLNTFGIRMYDVEFYQPERDSAVSVFIPIETVSLRIAA